MQKTKSFAIIVIIIAASTGTTGLLMPVTQVKADPKDQIFNEHTHEVCAIGVPNGCSTNSGMVINGPNGHENCNYNEHREHAIKCPNP